MRRTAFLLMAVVVVTATGCGGGSIPGGDRKAAEGEARGLFAEAPALDGVPEPPMVASREGDGPKAMLGESKTLVRERQAQSGILTAGSWDDNLNATPFRAFASKVGQLPGLSGLPGKFVGHRVVLSIKGADGSPIGNARVTVAAPDGRASVELTTRSDGRVVFLSALDQVPADADLLVTIQVPGNDTPVTQTVPRNVAHWDLTVPGSSKLPTHLDLALLIDTTGSMGDELEYIKREVKGIAEAIHAKFPQVQQRYALIVYRDEKDEYVTRRFDFTPSLDEFRRHLSAQSAGGGGDYPEAMHSAFEDATQLSWRSTDTARVLFLIADAPPHARFAERTLTAANTLRKQGVAIYPIAASGSDDATEFIMRSFAQMTGSQYLFLTDDSGVGNAHAEPHIPFYHVERLDRLMVRLIASELAGKRIEPQADEIVRTVGNPANGGARRPAQ